MTKQSQDVTLEDVDLALHFAALTTPRGVGWQRWVDQLLDARNELVALSGSTIDA